MDTKTIQISNFSRTRYGLWEARLQLPYSIIRLTKNAVPLSHSAYSILVLAEESGKSGLSEAQHNAVAFLISNFEMIYEKSFNKAYEYYENTREYRNYQLNGECDELTLNFANPELSDVSDFHNICELQIIHVHHLSSSGLACFGLEFKTSWNPENGTGVLIHGSDVLTVGSADVCVLPWIVADSLESAGKLID